ncbi:MAG: winged helix-turn-helix transcriptional regulator [Candidatus Rokubacteria bacterium]|nr:winged helix-turn-helix transcriptional regulator [Candidatus Rokubacteria bacterium]
MKPAALRDLRILTEIGEQAYVTQRGLSKSLGIALGLTNLYLKRLARKGYIKITTIPSNRVKYLLTPNGIAEKTRLTYEYMSFSLDLYAKTRRVLREALALLVAENHKRFALYGTGEAAELAYLTLREMGLEPVGVYGEGGGGVFLGLPVLPTEQLRDAPVDRVIVASFAATDGNGVVDVRAFVPDDRLIFLYRRPE